MSRQSQGRAILLLCVVAAWALLFYVLSFANAVSYIKHEPTVFQYPRYPMSTLPRSDRVEPNRTVSTTWYGATPEECLGCPIHYDENGDIIFYTANGDRYDENAMVAAANWVPLGTKMELTWGSNRVVVDITDRMLSDYNLDLSKAAFEELTGDLSIGQVFTEARIIYIP